jgi:hypothetical protein
MHTAESSVQIIKFQNMHRGVGGTLLTVNNKNIVLHTADAHRGVGGTLLTVNNNLSLIIDALHEVNKFEWSVMLAKSVRVSEM